MVGRVVRRVGQYAERTAAIRTAARERYRTPWLPVQWRAMRLRRRYGWGLDESLSAGLLDPETFLDPELAASPRQTTDLQYFMNARQIEAVSEDKVIFDMLARAAGIPAPETYAVFMDGAMGWDHRHRRPIHPEAWADAITALPDELVLKPSQGYYGLGVKVLRRDGFAWHDVGEDARITTPQVVEHMTSDPLFKDWVAQERLRNHPDIAHLGGDALHTLRLVSFIGDDGAVEFVWAGFRVAVGARAIDNFRGGKLGNMTCEIDLADGRITAAYVPREDRPGLRPSPEHPVTGDPLVGLTLPHWEACRELVTRAAPVFLPIRTIGFDLGLTADGPRAVEINMWWDVPPVAPARPILDRLWERGHALKGT